METMTVKDLQDRENLTLVTDSQDIEAICINVGCNPLAFGCLFVEVKNGEYGDIYGCYSNIPCLRYPAEKIN